MAGWLADAPTAIAKLMASRPPRFSEAILKTTQEEQAKGFCSPFFTKEEMDGQFGCGQWRPLERFIITQPCGKQRVIDNARKTEHNAATTLHETIYTVHLDFIASMAADLSNKLRLLQPPMECPEVDWLSLRLGTDDLPDAYRALPVRPDHQGYSVVAVFVHGAGWRFTKLYGLAFGLESAVVSFNRWPQLAIAISRRCVCSLSAAYFDDGCAWNRCYLQTHLSRACALSSGFLDLNPRKQKDSDQLQTATILVLPFIWVLLHLKALYDFSRSSLLPRKCWQNSTMPCKPTSWIEIALASYEEISNGCTPSVPAT